MYLTYQLLFLLDVHMQATFRMMPSTQRYGLDPETIQKDGMFDWENEVPLPYLHVI